MANVTMKYGTYNFNPVPMINFAKEYNKTEDGRILNTATKLSLNGMLAIPPNSTGGIYQLNALKTGLVTAFNQQGSTLLLKCDNTNILSINPRILSLQFRDSSNNWLMSVPYSIELEYQDSASGEISNAQYVDSVSNTWSIEPIEDQPYFTWSPSGIIDSSPYLFKIIHHISAKGRAIYANTNVLAGSGNPDPYENARDFCNSNLGTVAEMLTLLNSPPANILNLRLYNYHRVQNADKWGGSYTVDENWMLYKSMSGTHGYAIENFTVDIKQSDTNNIATVGIQGTIQGLERITLTGIDVLAMAHEETKYYNAQSYWNGVKSLLPVRAKYAYDVYMTGVTKSLNLAKTNKSVGVNPKNGTINYNYEWTNTPSPLIAGAISENISFDYSFPTDKYAMIDILGRKSGPVIQLLDSRTPYELSLNIDVVVDPVAGTLPSHFYLSNSSCPHDNVKVFLSLVESELSTQYTTLVKTQDKPSWNPKAGSYRRNVVWVYNNCVETGTAISGLL